MFISELHDDRAARLSLCGFFLLIFSVPLYRSFQRSYWTSSEEYFGNVVRVSYALSLLFITVLSLDAYAALGLFTHRICAWLYSLFLINLFISSFSCIMYYMDTLSKMEIVASSQNTRIKTSLKVFRWIFRLFLAVTIGAVIFRAVGIAKAKNTGNVQLLNDSSKPYLFMVVANTVVIAYSVFYVLYYMYLHIRSTEDILNREEEYHTWTLLQGYKKRLFKDSMIMVAVLIGIGCTFAPYIFINTFSNKEPYPDVQYIEIYDNNLHALIWEVGQHAKLRYLPLLSYDWNTWFISRFFMPMFFGTMLPVTMTWVPKDVREEESSVVMTEITLSHYEQ